MTDDPDQRRFLLGGAFFGFVFLMLCVAHASAPIYFWVDKYGNLHATDRLEGVPSIYRDAYAEEAQNPSYTRTETKIVYVSQSSAREPKTSRGVKPLANKDKDGVKIMAPSLGRAALDLKLRNTNDELAQVNKELGALRFNPILRETPAVKTKIEDAEKKQRKLIAEVDLLKKRVADNEEQKQSSKKNKK